MNIRGVAGATVFASLTSIGLAPVAHAADDIERQTCLAVMAMGATPDSYAITLVTMYPDMTYNQARALVQRAFESVQYHQNPMCNGVTIPDDY
ncbi:hypothetical protein BCA37_11050 [Mycobacterium sp. djl-10]|nr:hypothetical protein BCA37_11050 [Mycobacterium sp. djl-10]